VDRVEWWRQAACHEHPVLPWTAWFDVEAGVPRTEGARALIVCRYGCPVMQQCRTRYNGVDAIYGGGWADGNGTFHDPGDDVMDVYQAAAYLGMETERFRRMVHKKLKPAYYKNGRNWYLVNDVVGLIRKSAHGTKGAQEAHLLRAEPMCSQCQHLYDLMNQTFAGSELKEVIEGVPA
jgi:hypothetical protein